MPQDIFSSGAIKSATDFQVYKELGGLSGLDFAYVDNTAVYHTKVIWHNYVLQLQSIQIPTKLSSSTFFTMMHIYLVNCQKIHQI